MLFNLLRPSDSLHPSASSFESNFYLEKNYLHNIYHTYDFDVNVNVNAAYLRAYLVFQYVYTTI